MAQRSLGANNVTLSVFNGDHIDGIMGSVLVCGRLWVRIQVGLNKKQ